MKLTHFPQERIPYDLHHCCVKGSQLICICHSLFCHPPAHPSRKRVASKNILRNNYEIKAKH